jgi:hypothetical protein
MYETIVYVEHEVSNKDLTRAFARATRSAPTAVAIVESAEVDGAIDEFGDPARPTVIRRWVHPGEFTLALDILFQQAGISTEQETLAVLHQVAADLNVPLLSIETDVPAAFRAIFPDGSEAIVDEDLTVADPALVLTTASRRVYDARRSASPRAALTAG